MTCAIGEACGVDALPGRTFQARDRWGHPGATSGPRTTGSQRTTAVTSGPASSQLTGHIRPGSAGRRKCPTVPDTEEVIGRFRLGPGDTTLMGPRLLVQDEVPGSSPGRPPNRPSTSRPPLPITDARAHFDQVNPRRRRSTSRCVRLDWSHAAITVARPAIRAATTTPKVLISATIMASEI
jgi:hypothetical protein